MSLNLFYNKLFVSVIIISVLFAKILEPESKSKYLEVIYKNNKPREYDEITRNGLEYNIKGPAEVKIFSKAAFPKKTAKELKYFNFNISINGLSSESNNSKNIDRNTTSLSHPMHVYTYSAKDVIVLPGGDYKIKIQNQSVLGPPILVRLLRSGRKSKKIVKEEVDIVDNFARFTLKSLNSTFSPSYYVLDNLNPLYFNDIEGLFELNLRGLHNRLTDSSKVIKTTLLKNGRKDTKYHILSIPHPSKILNEDNRIPGKLNKIYIDASQDNYFFHMEEFDSALIVRLNRIVE